MKWGYISAYKLDTERALLLPVPQVPANGAKVPQNHDAREAVLATLSVLKGSKAIFRP